MFVIVYNNFVILGPMKWNKGRFQNVILEECEIETFLPNTNEDSVPIFVNDQIKILPIQDGLSAQFNSKIEILHGPFWEFTETHAIRTYQTVSKPIELVKGELKAQVATERWKKEVSGVKTVIQNTEISVDTNRGDRDIFIQKYLLMNENDTVLWKFPETWLTLTKSELGQIVAVGAMHIQQSFEWEAHLVNQIESATTLEELNLIVIVEPENESEFPNFPLGY